MVANTVADVEDAVNNSLSWRRIELHALKSAIYDAEKNSPGSPLARALARSGVALLYAHWEGFISDSCQAYVNYVAKRRLRLAELNDGLLRTALASIAKKAAVNDERGIAALVEVVRNPQSRALLPKKTMVNTRSNLRFEVLVEIFESLGFPLDKFETKGPLINSSLCDGRNSIAHGRDLCPGPGAFEDLHREVLEMMVEVQSMIRDCVRGDHYKA
jgi:MAE_28990/MAE_18760-like HEPN